MDTLSPPERSALMSKIRNRDTAPEILVRKTIHGMGLRFRKNVRGLPGTPDVVLKRWKTVVLVHGCFWHRHTGCKRAYNPRTRSDFWQSKFSQNVERDKHTMARLQALGWTVVVVWECQAREATLVRQLILEALPTGVPLARHARPDSPVES